jgi:hypothetical protein
MKKVIREYWAWVVLPFVLVVGTLAYLVVAGGPGDSVAPFIYRVF